MAIIRALEEWRHYIQGSPHTTTILSDHKNLTYYCEARKLNRQQARWSLYLSEYDVKLVHTPGSKMVQSDAHSRRPDYIPEEDMDNDDITMLPEELFVNLIDTELQERIVNCDKMDKDASEALITLLGKGKIEDWTMEKFNDRNILFFKGRNYIPISETLRKDVAKLFHNYETAGHPGELETYNAIQQHYWW